jgi:hypothetical protein
MCLNEACSEISRGKNLPDAFYIRNVLKQGSALSQLLYNFALKCEIRKVQENQEGM